MVISDCDITRRFPIVNLMGSSGFSESILTQIQLISTVKLILVAVRVFRDESKTYAGDGEFPFFAITNLITLLPKLPRILGPLQKL